MATTFIPFDGWQPGASYFGEGWGTVNNLVPHFGDWKPWNTFSPTFSPAIGPVTGNHVHLWATGGGTGTYVPDAQTIFAGTGSLTATPERLYVIDPIALSATDISRGGGYSALTAGWRFASVGNDIWAVNWTDAMQRRTNNAGNFADGVVSTFKPMPRFLTKVREHLFVGNLSNAGRFQDEVAWSDADDATNFDPPAGGSTSISIAGSKRLSSISGQLTGLVGGQYGLAFKRRCIYYAEYTGDQQVFRFDVLSLTIGTSFPSSIIQTKYGIFFFGPDGFYVIQGLSEPQKISTPGIDREILGGNFAQFPASLAAAWVEDSHLIGFQFFQQPLIGWLLNKNQTTIGSDVAIVYNPVTQQWSQLTMPALVTSIVQRPTAETLFDATAAFTYNGAVVGYSPQNAGIFSVPTMGLNFRPANVDDGLRIGQSKINWVLPVFSKVGVGATTISPTVTVEAMLDPYVGVWGSPTIISIANRDQVSGAYPIQLAGRFFRITVTGAAEDFSSFEGLWVDQEMLR